MRFCVCVCVYFKKFLNVFNVDYKSEALDFFLVFSQTSTYTRDGFEGSKQPWPGKNLYLSSELATAQEKHKGMPTFTVWGAPPKLNKQPLFGNHQ